jgi:hypothetical protein
VDKFEARVRALLEFKNRWGGLVLKQGERAVAAANALGKTPQKETVRQAPEATVSFAINNHLDITKRHTPPCTTRIHHGKALKTGYGALRDSMWPSEDEETSVLRKNRNVAVDDESSCPSPLYA